MSNIMKHICILISFFFYIINGFAQSSNLQIKSNSFDAKGRKIGFWSENDKGFKIERYYLNGIKNGLEKVYYRNCMLATFLQFKNGKTIGLGYFFHEKGYLIQTIEYLGLIIYKDKKLQKGHFRIYNINGSIKYSGIGLFKEGDEELGEEIRIGKWK